MIAFKDAIHVEAKNFNSSSPYSICLLTKQKKLLFVSHNNVALYSFDLIHCDIWGPYQHLSHVGYRYFLNIVDDFSHFKWTFMMKTKSEASVIVPWFFAVIETHFGVHIKQFRSDNASELAFTEFFSSKGVVHQFSCVARLEQNSVVERKHQHLLNGA